MKRNRTNCSHPPERRTWRSLVPSVVEKAGRIFILLLLKIMSCTVVLFEKVKSICFLVFSLRRNLHDLFWFECRTFLCLSENFCLKNCVLRYCIFLCREKILFNFFKGIIKVRFFFDLTKRSKKTGLLLCLFRYFILKGKS